MIDSNTLRHAIQRLLVASLLILAWAPELPAQATAFPVIGIVADADQVPVVGYRVVLRATGSDAVYLSGPTDEEGAYRVDVPTGVNLRPVAVISPLGGRIAIDGILPQPVLPGVRFDIELGIRLSVVTEPRPFPGADRLFLSFVEDVVFVERERVETQVAGADFDDATSYLTELLGAYNFTALPRLEVGGRVGYAGTEFDSTGAGVTGMTDLELWGKQLVYTSPSSGLRSSAGALLTLPTGDADTGRASGAFGAKLFGALRYDVWRLTLAANGGLRFTGDSDIDGVDRTGQVSGSLAAAALLPLGTRLVGVGELGYESARYEDGLDEGVALLGVNWNVLREGILRLAIGFGLADGSPDAELVAGYAFEF